MVASPGPSGRGRHIDRGNRPLGQRAVRRSGATEVDAGAVLQPPDPVHAGDQGQLVGAAVVGATGERLDDRVEPGGGDPDERLALAGGGSGNSKRGGWSNARRTAACISGLSPETPERDTGPGHPEQQQRP